MIPLPPQDPVLGSLGVALDEETMVDVLSRRLPACASGRLRLKSCRPTHVRYVPRDSYQVEYKLSLRDRRTGSRVKIRAHTRLLRGQRAAELASGLPLRRVVEACAWWHPHPMVERAAYLPELRAIIELFPVDLELPALARAVCRGEMRPLLAEALGDHQAGECEVELVRYKPGLRAVMRYRLPCSDHEVTVYGKLHRDERVCDPGRVADAMLRSGVATPPPLAWIQSARMLLQAEAKGRPLEDLRGTDEFESWMAPVATTLAQMHRTELGGLSTRSLNDFASTALSAARMIGTLLPGLAGEASWLTNRLVSFLGDVSPQAATTHGDFTPLQILVSEAGPVLVDFDEVHRGHPLVDVGRFLAALVMDTGRNDSERARAAFLDAYLAARPYGAELVALFEAAELLKAASTPFRLLRPAWPIESERLVRLAAERLFDYEAGRGAGASGRLGRATLSVAHPVGA